MIGLSTTGEMPRREAEPDALRSEQAELLARAAGLELLLASLAGAESDAADRADAVGQLRSLRTHLRAHFAAEERGGLLAHAAAVEPRFAPRIEQLRQEHGELGGRMDGLLATATGLRWTVVHAQFAALRRALRAHEEAESDLLLRTYMEDIGGHG